MEMRWGCTRPRGPRHPRGLRHHPLTSSPMQASPSAPAHQTPAHPSPAVPSQVAQPSAAGQAAPVRLFAAGSPSCAMNGSSQPAGQQVQQGSKRSLWLAPAVDSVQSGAGTVQPSGGGGDASHCMPAWKDRLIGSHPPSVTASTRALLAGHVQLGPYKGSIPGFAALDGSQRQSWFGHEQQQAVGVLGCHKQAVPQVCVMLQVKDWWNLRRGAVMSSKGCTGWVDCCADFF